MKINTNSLYELLTPEVYISFGILFIPLLLSFLFKSSFTLLVILSVILIFLDNIINLVFNWSLLIIFAPTITIAKYFGLFLLSILLLFKNHTHIRNLIINLIFGGFILYFMYKIFIHIIIF